MKKAEYKIVNGKSGFPELEENVSKMLNQGWKPVGGIAFNAGFPYQAMAKVITAKHESENKIKTQDTLRNPVGANTAMRAIDNLT